MCGIAGIYNAEVSTTNTDFNLINAIITDQKNRGPDHHAIIAIDDANNVNKVTSLLGHNRLAIIDLSIEANQPMWDSENEFCIVCNGQIYNYIELKQELIQLQYQFVTTSDTEVILRAFRHWREKCVEHFNGMFAFAILEKKTGQLWIFRDRFGVKPIFYTVRNNKLFFASSSSILAKAFGLTPNVDYLFRGLNYLCYEDGSDLTAYQGLQSVPAGHYLTAKLHHSKLEISITHYYSLSQRVVEYQQQLLNKTSSALYEDVFAQVNQAVNIRLRADDSVRVGITLSSGLDSSSIAALVNNQLSHQFIPAFTFGSPAIRTMEAAAVARLSDALNIDTHYVMPKPQNFAEVFWKTLAAQDAPFASCSVIAQYFVYQAAHQRGIKILLSGQGADEIFLGYKKFQFYYLKQILQQKHYKKSIEQLLGMSLSFFHYFPHLKQFYLDLYRYRHIHKNRRQVFHQDKTKTLLEYSIDDISRFSLPTLLRYEDCNSMANSVESRLPFLDYHLVELALALPDALKIKYGYGKWIMRELMQPYLPSSITRARIKRGFDVGNAYWINRGLGDSLRDALQQDQAYVTDYLPNTVNINQRFSNSKLHSNSNRFAEMVSLIWLANKRK